MWRQISEGFVEVERPAQKKEGAKLMNNLKLYVNISLVSTVVIIRLIKR